MESGRRTKETKADDAGISEQSRGGADAGGVGDDKKKKDHEDSEPEMPLPMVMANQKLLAKTRLLCVGARTAEYDPDEATSVQNVGKVTAEQGASETIPTATTETEEMVPQKGAPIIRSSQSKAGQTNEVREGQRQCEVPGAYSIVNPNAVGQVSDSTSFLETEDEDEVREEASLPKPPVLGAFLVEDTNGLSQTASSHSGDFDLEHGYSETHLVEAVKSEDIDNSGRTPRLALAGVLLLASIVVVLSLGLASVFDSSEPMGGAEQKTDVPSANTITPHMMTTIETIQAKGFLPCAYEEFTGIMYKDENGEVTGFSAALCYAVAAALAVEVKFFPKEEPNGMVQAFWTRTHTMELAVNHSLSFSAPIMYAGLKIGGDPWFVDNCVDKGLKHIDECNELRICVDFDATHYNILGAFVPARYLIPIDRVNGTAFSGVLDGSCNVVAEESLFLAPAFALSAGYEGPYTISKSYFSKEPIAVVTPSEDPEWTDLVGAVVQALFVAEQYNITRAKADFFPLTLVFGEKNQEMFRNVIRKVGNFAEIYMFLDALMPRVSLNEINQGNTGLLYSHPFGQVSQRMGGRSLGPTHSRVLQDRVLRCGVRINRQGFVNKNGSGDYFGFDIDLCMALAASLFGGDATAVEYVDLTDPADGFIKLASGAVDIIAGAPLTLQNDVKEATTGVGFSFTQPYYYGYSVEEDSLCMATRQDDHDWSSHVYWIMETIIYAEEQRISQNNSNEMPQVEVFGEGLHRAFKDAILRVGNYGDIYTRNMEEYAPRTGRNMLNEYPTVGPQHYPMTGFFG